LYADGANGCARRQLLSSHIYIEEDPTAAGPEPDVSISLKQRVLTLFLAGKRPRPFGPPFAILCIALKQEATQ
jgi:hypothetical protein